MESSAVFFFVFLVFSAMKGLCIAQDTCLNTSDVGDRLVLTPYIQNNSVEMARNLSKTEILGWSGYSGYLTVNETCGGNLFFWFFLAKNNSAEAPLMVWLNGGPGSSSFFGWLCEIGHIRYSNGSVSLNNNTSNYNNNILYFDQPIGTGFSFPKNDCLVETVADSTKQLYVAMVQFFKVFPEYQKNELYLTGQSFAGHYIPALGVYVHDMNKRPSVEVRMNLKGVLIGNPTTRLDCRNYAHLIYNIGYAGVELRDLVNDMHGRLVEYIERENFTAAYAAWRGIYEVIGNVTQLPSFWNYMSVVEDYIDYPSWLDTPEVRCRLHAGDEPFLDASQVVFDKMALEMTRAQQFNGYVETLARANYTLWFVSGNIDVTCLTTSTDCLLRRLRWWGADGFRRANRTAWFHGGELAGYFRWYGNVRFVVFANAGHSVPFYVPARVRNMVDCLNFCPENDPVCYLNTTVP